MANEAGIGVRLAAAGVSFYQHRITTFLGASPFLQPGS